MDNIGKIIKQRRKLAGLENHLRHVNVESIRIRDEHIPSPSNTPCRFEVDLNSPSHYLGYSKGELHDLLAFVFNNLGTEDSIRERLSDVLIEAKLKCDNWPMRKRFNELDATHAYYKKKKQERMERTSMQITNTKREVLACHKHMLELLAAENLLHLVKVRESGAITFPKDFDIEIELIKNRQRNDYRRKINDIRSSKGLPLLKILEE